jgi:hypothetical protein
LVPAKPAPVQVILKRGGYTCINITNISPTTRVNYQTNHKLATRSDNMGIDLARRKASIHWYRMVPVYQSTIKTQTRISKQYHNTIAHISTKQSDNNTSKKGLIAQ